MRKTSIAASIRPTMRAPKKGLDKSTLANESEADSPIRVLTEAVRRTPGDVPLLRDLAGLFVRDGQPNDAIALLLHALTITRDAELLKAVHLDLAMIFDEALSDAERAIAHLRSALELAPRDGDVLRALSAILARHGAQGGPAPSQAATRASDDGPSQTRIATSNKERPSVATIPRDDERVSRAHDHVRSQETRPSLVKSPPKPVARAQPRGREELQKHLDTHPEDATAWLELCICFEREGRRDAAFRCAQVLDVLDRGVPKVPLSRYAAHPASAYESSFTRGVIENLGSGLAPVGVAGELLAALEGYFAFATPRDLTRYGTTQRARVAEGAPLRKLAERVAAILCVRSFDLILHRARGRNGGIELGEPPALVVPASLEAQTEARRVFELARLLTLRALGLACLARLTGDEVQSAVRAYVCNVQPTFMPRQARDAAWSSAVQRWHQTTSPSERTRAGEAALRYAKAPVVMAMWVEHQKRLAIRVSALLADDLRAAYEALDSEDDRHDLLRFWVSELAMRARARAGIA